MTRLTAAAPPATFGKEANIQVRRWSGGGRPPRAPLHLMELDTIGIHAMHEHLIDAQGEGRPVVVGTHVIVETILRELAEGESVEHLLTTHPDLSREAILAALAFAAAQLQTPASQPPSPPFAEALGSFVPQTPLAKELWELRQAAIKESLDRGEPLLHDWAAVQRDVRERRGERDHGDDA